MLFRTLVVAALLGAAAPALAQGGDREVLLSGPICPREPYVNTNVRIHWSGVTLTCDATIEVIGGNIYVDGPIVGLADHGPSPFPGVRGGDSFDLTLIATTSDASDVGGDIVFSGGGNVDLRGGVGSHGAQAVSGHSGGQGGDGGDGGSFTAIADGHIFLMDVLTDGGPGGPGAQGGSDCGGAGIGSGGEGGSGGHAGSVSVAHSGSARDDAVIMYRTINANGGEGMGGGRGGQGARCGPGTVAGVGGNGGGGGNGGPVELNGRIVYVHNTNQQATIVARGGRAGEGGAGAGALSLVGNGCSVAVAGGPDGGRGGAGGTGGSGGPITVTATRRPTSEDDPGSLLGTLHVDSGGGAGGMGAPGGAGGKWEIGGDPCAYKCGGPGASGAGGGGGAAGGVRVSAPRFNIGGRIDAQGGAGGSGDDGASHGCPCGAGAQGGSAGAPGFGGGASLGGEPFYTPLPGAPTFTVNLYGGAGGSGGDGGLYRGASGRGSCQPRTAGFANLTNPPVVWEWAINPNPGCGGDGSPGPRCLP